MDINTHFAEAIQQYTKQWNLHQVYSDPMARSFIVERSTKKLRIFDFDDTLVKVDGTILVKNNGKETLLSPAEFAVYTPKPGDSFNFKDFNRMITKSVDIMKNINLLKQASNDPAVKTTILTARLLAYPVKKYLKDRFNLDVYVVALGDSNPQKKADYIEKEIKKGYNDIVFIDDSIKNVNAVSKLKQQYPTVNLTVIHTTEAEHIKF